MEDSSEFTEFARSIIAFSMFTLEVGGREEFLTKVDDDV